MRISGPTQKVKTKEYTLSTFPEQYLLEGPRNHALHEPLWLITAQNHQNLQAQARCQPRTTPPPKADFLSPSPALLLLPSFSWVSSLFSPGAQISPAVTIPPPSSPHLAPPPPLAGSTHKAWGNTESSWAGLGGKGHRGGGEGQEAASFVTDIHTSAPAPSSSPSCFPSHPPPQGGRSGEGSGEKEGMPHPLRRGKMAPDHRSQPRAPSCQQRTDRKWQGRECG